MNEKFGIIKKQTEKIRKAIDHGQCVLQCSLINTNSDLPSVPSKKTRK